MQPLTKSGGPSDCFEPTRWSVVLAAGNQDDATGAAQAALGQLCQTYWSPLYGFVRGRGYPTHEAQDLTQGFFLHLIEHQIYARTSREKGKFRSFLLASLKNFLLDAHGREQALKRGGGCEFLSLHEEQAGEAEAMFQSGVISNGVTTEDHLFERQWAEALVKAAFDGLAAEYNDEGKGDLFRALGVFVRCSADPLPGYDQLASLLEMPAVTVRSHVARLRSRYRVRLRAELRRTVASEKEVDDELHELLRVLSTR